MNEIFSHIHHVYNKEIQVSWLVTMHCAMHADYAPINHGDEHVLSVLAPRT